MGPRILLVGPWLYSWYHEACAEALEQHGCSVVPFGWRDDFYVLDRATGLPRARNTWRALQNRLIAGPAVSSLNERLLVCARDAHPDVVWMYNATHIRPSTLEILRHQHPSAVFAQFTNDNPFAGQTSRRYWRHLVASLGQFDIHFAYRHANVDRLKAETGKPAHLLRSYFVPDQHYADSGAASERSADVVFVGHYENDCRLEAIEALVRASLTVRVFGNGWPSARQVAPDAVIAHLLPIQPVLGADYRRATAESRISLCFLSKLNEDTYTRRNFEIPAMGAFMLSEYSDDLASLFTEGVEAEFFRDQEELVDKARFYAIHDAARQRIAHAGHARVHRDAHDVVSRMRQFLRAVDTVRQ